SHIFFTDTASTVFYALSLHDALPISILRRNNGNAQIVFVFAGFHRDASVVRETLLSDVQASHDFKTRNHGGMKVAHVGRYRHGLDRKSTRLNSSHVSISYAVFCLKKK